MILVRSTPTFVIIFAVAFASLYLLAVENNWALFTYHPALETFGLFVEKTKDGPAMYWYGWIATAAIGALAIATLASCLPNAVTGRIGPIWSWLIPSLVMLNFAYLLRSFFLR